MEAHPNFWAALGRFWRQSRPDDISSLVSPALPAGTPSDYAAHSYLPRASR